MADYTLQCFVASGNPCKAALMLTLCQSGWQPQRVDCFSGGTTREDFGNTNTTGEVREDNLPSEPVN